MVTAPGRASTLVPFEPSTGLGHSYPPPGVENVTHARAPTPASTASAAYPALSVVAASAFTAVTRTSGTPPPRFWAKRCFAASIRM